MVLNDFLASHGLSPNRLNAWQLGNKLPCTALDLDTYLDLFDPPTLTRLPEGLPCSECPFQRECLATAIAENNWEGIRAGMTPAQRAQYAAEHGLPAPTPAKNGSVFKASMHATPSMYRKGCRCEACKKAMSDYRAQKREEKRYDPPKSPPPSHQPEARRERYKAAREQGLTRDEARRIA